MLSEIPSFQEFEVTKTVEEKHNIFLTLPPKKILLEEGAKYNIS